MLSLEEKRKAFLAAEWVRLDGLPSNPLAQKDCQHCGGHGVLDDGDMAPIYVNCTSCHTAEAVRPEESEATA